MKILISTLLLFTLNVSAALITQNPSYKAFDTNYFEVYLGNPPRISINTNLLDGLDGTNGATGPQGPAGADGPQGPAGPAGTNAVAIRDGVEVFPFAYSNAVPTAAAYWLDFGRTNAGGERLIYQSINATNGVMLYGLTNCQRWDLLSINIVAAATNQWVYFPTSLPHFDTNGMSLIDTRGWGLLLYTNHNLVFTLQSNALTLTTIWVTPEQ